jgi:hypothetical protein
VARTSHAKCRECGKVRHRFARFNVCGACWERKKTAMQAERRERKERREARRTPEPENTPLTIADAIELALEEKPMPRGRPPVLTPEQELEIVNLYTTTDTPVQEIADTYSIGRTGPFKVLDRHGISWRRNDTQPAPQRLLPPHIEAMKSVHVASTLSPEDFVDTSLTAKPGQAVFDLKEPNPVPNPVPTLSAPDDIPVYDRKLPAIEELSRPKWSIEFRATLTVHADTASAAIREAEAMGYSSIDIDVVRRLA